MEGQRGKNDQDMVKQSIRKDAERIDFYYRAIVNKTIRFLHKVK